MLFRQGEESIKPNNNNATSKMNDKVYQVRVYPDYNNDKGNNWFADDENGEWEFEDKMEAIALFFAYKKEGDERIVLTETPKASEEECQKLGIDYEVKEICLR